MILAQLSKVVVRKKYNYVNQSIIYSVGECFTTGAVRQFHIVSEKETHASDL